MLIEGVRVLDLTDCRGYLCGRILADLGADVIKIEPPGGDPGRMVGPFYGNEQLPEKSLSWWAYNANKRGITLDITRTEAKGIFRNLVRSSQCVVESFPPGYMDELGIGYHELSAANEKLVFTSVSPFGSEGPWAKYEASDLVGAALGGLMIWTGEADSPPLRIGVPQSYLFAGGQGAVASCVALYHAQATGEGQRIDVSMLESWLPSVSHAIAHYALSNRILSREGKYRSGEGAPNVKFRNLWECKDGYVVTRIWGGLIGAKTNAGFARWMEEEGMIDKLWQGREWENFDLMNVTPELIQSLEKPLQEFLKTKTKAEIYRRALVHKMQVAPLNTSADILEYPHLKARGFWQEVSHPEIGKKFYYAGSFARIPGMPLGIKRRAPLIGEHNSEVFGEIGVSQEEIIALKERGII